jgi:preprotein translocase subunit SecA
VTMTLEQIQTLIIQFITEKYQRLEQEQLVAHALESIETFKNVFEVIEEASLGYLNFSTISSDNDKEEREIIFAMLEEAIDYTENKFKVNEETLKKNIASLQKKIQDTPELKSKHLQNSNLGIREKLENGILTSHEWLSELDLKRMLTASEMKDQVYITRLQVADIGMALYFKRKEHEEKMTPCYTIPFILNIGSDDLYSGSHWLSAKITVDTQTKQITYQVDDSRSLDVNDKEKIRNIIESAIFYNEECKNSNVKFQAFANSFHINKEESKIEGSCRQNNSFLCGYYALYKSFEYLTPTKLNKQATSYLKCETIDKLIESVYLAQCENESTTKMEAFISDNLNQVASPSSPIKNSESVIKNNHWEYLDGLNLTTKVTTLTFPRFKDNTAEDYEDYLLELNGKLENKNIILQTLIIQPCTIGVLDGLNKFLANNRKLNVKNIQLEIDEVNPALFDRLNILLLNLSVKDIKQIRLNDRYKSLNNENLGKLLFFIRNRKVCTDVLLPDHLQNSDSQKDIDNAVSDNKLSANIQFLEKKINNQVINKFSQDTSRNRKIRTREFGSIKNKVAVDLEMQQEQHRQIEVTVTHEQHLNTQQDEKTHEKLRTLNTFPHFQNYFNQLRHEVDPDLFSSGNDYLSESDLKELYENIFGHILSNESIGRQYNLPNDYLDGGITRAAVREIIIQYKKSKFGFDFNPNRLPSGFIIFEEGRAKVLHYDPYQALAHKAPMPRISLINGSRALPSSNSTFITIMKKLSKEDEKEKYLLDQWEKLNIDYNREATDLFKQFLPKLLRFKLEDLKVIFELLLNRTKSKEYHNHEFKFLLTQLPHVARSYEDILAEPADPNAPNVIDEETVQRKERGNQIIALAKRNRIDNTPLKAHLIFRLKGKGKIFDKILDELSHLATNLSLTNDNLDAFLQVYNQYAELGLQKLLPYLNNLNQSDPSLLAFLFNTIFKTMESYSPLLTEQYQQAITTISTFTGNKKKWWEFFLQNHCNNIDNDDLVALVKSFNLFCSFIEQEDLDFYPLSDNSFADVKNMPLTLGWIMTILEKCPKKDRKIQWSVIDKISLTSSSSMRAIITKDANPCQFVLPEMAITPPASEPIVRRLYKTEREEWRYIAQDFRQKIRKESEVEREFYLDLSTQRHRLSLDFYKKAIAATKEKNFSSETQARLIAILATTTCGELNFPQLDSEETSLKQWQAILNLLKNLPIPAVAKVLEYNLQNHFVNFLYTTSELPCLPILKNMFTTIRNSVQVDEKINLVKIIDELNTKAEKLLNKAVMLRKITKKENCGTSIYEGMRLYTQEEYELRGDDSIFMKHIAVANNIFDGLNQRQDAINNSTLKKGLLQLISIFHIVEDDTLKEILDTSVKTTDAVTLFSYLSKIEKNVNKGEKLTPEDLLRLLRTVARYRSELTSRHNFFPIRDLVEIFKNDKVKDFFPKNYLETLNSRQILAPIKTLIKDKFEEDERTIVTEILSSTSVHDDATYELLINKLSKIMTGLSPEVRKDFLVNLSREEIYVPETGPLGSNEKISVEQFIELLDSILNKGNVNNFIYLLSLDESKNCKGLANRVICYLNKMLPSSYERSSKELDNYDLAKIYSKLVLKAEVKEKTKLGSTEEVKENVSELNEIFEIKKDDPTILSEALRYIEEIKKNFTNPVPLQSLDEFKQKLEEFNQYSPFFEKKILKELIDALKKAIPDPRIKTLFHMIWGAKSPAPASNASPSVQSRTNSNTPPSKAVLNFRTLGKKFSKWRGKSPAPASNASPSAEFTLSLLDKTMSSIQQCIKDESKQTFLQVSEKITHTISKVIEKNPKYKHKILSFFDNYLSEDHSITKKLDFVQVIQKGFLKIQNEEIILSLYHHFDNKQGNKEGKFTHQNLFEIFTNLNPLPNNSDKELILNIVTILLNNEHKITYNQIDELINLCRDEKDGQKFLEKIRSFYESIPYPSLEALFKWHDDSQGDGYSEKMDNCYKDYDTNLERDNNNGFKLAHAKARAREFDGVDFEDSELEAFSAEIKKLKSESSKNLVDEFKKFKENKNEEINYKRLIAIAAELLHRSKKKEGDTYEINTTQYLAIWSMLKSNNLHVTSQIDTGEGKSRIMMITAACLNALGLTVDFVTSNMTLSARDYLEYQPYFKSLGAKVNLIYASSNINTYSLDGINFSDSNSLPSFRNKARSEGNGDKVINPNPKKRAVLLDEGDNVFYDSANTRINCSSSQGHSLESMEWIYPLLVKFFLNRKLDKDHPFYSDVDSCNQMLKNFIISELDEDKERRIAQLDDLPQSEFEGWQGAAIAAQSLKFGDDYVIDSTKIILTTKGLLKTSQAIVRINYRADRNSKFSFGLHQCLLAQLEYYRRHPNRLPENSPLRQKLKGVFPFYIPPENKITYSSTSKVLLNDYAEGVLIATTGSSGADVERYEAALLYAAKGSEGSDPIPMQFIKVPRHQEFKRDDKPPMLLANRERLVEETVAQIEDSSSKNQPILIFCEDDQASEQMLQDLQKKFAGLEIKINQETPGVINIQIIDSLMTYEEEQRGIELAGNAKRITISTPMSARGAHIKLSEEAKKSGLKTLVTFLPRRRDLIQMLGRSARQKDNGETRILLDQEKLKAQLGQGNLSDGFYTATNQYISQLQDLMDKKEQFKRLISNLISDFNQSLTDHFYDAFLPAVLKEGMTPKTINTLIGYWSNFSTEKDLIWNKIWDEINKAPDLLELSEDEIQDKMTEFHTLVQGKWKELHDNITRFAENSPRVAAHITKLKESIDEIKYEGNKNIQQIKLASTHAATSTPNVEIYDEYDKAHDGRAVLYTKPWTQFRAVFAGKRSPFADLAAWWRGEGLAFPNLTAWRKGEMSFAKLIRGTSSKPPFVETMAFRKQQNEIQKNKYLISLCSPSSHALQLYSKEMCNGKLAEMSRKKLIKEWNKLGPSDRLFHLALTKIDINFNFFPSISNKEDLLRSELKSEAILTFLSEIKRLCPEIGIKKYQCPDKYARDMTDFCSRTLGKNISPTAIKIRAYCQLIDALKRKDNFRESLSSILEKELAKTIEDKYFVKSEEAQAPQAGNDSVSWKTLKVNEILNKSRGRGILKAKSAKELALISHIAEQLLDKKATATTDGQALKEEVNEGAQVKNEKIPVNEEDDSAKKKPELLNSFCKISDDVSNLYSKELSDGDLPKMSQKKLASKGHKLSKEDRLSHLAIANIEANFRFFPAISNKKDLFRSELKREAISIFKKEIGRLCSLIGKQAEWQQNENLQNIDTSFIAGNQSRTAIKIKAYCQLIDALKREDNFAKSLSNILEEELVKRLDDKYLVNNEPATAEKNTKVSGQSSTVGDILDSSRGILKATSAETLSVVKEIARMQADKLTRALPPP